MFTFGKPMHPTSELLILIRGAMLPVRGSALNVHKFKSPTNRKAKDSNMKFQVLFLTLFSLSSIQAQTTNQEDNDIKDTLLASCEKDGTLIEFSSTVSKNVAVYLSGQGDSNIDGNLEQTLDSIKDPVLIYEALCGGPAPDKLIAAVEEEKDLQPDLGDV